MMLEGFAWRGCGRFRLGHSARPPHRNVSEHGHRLGPGARQHGSGDATGAFDLRCMRKGNFDLKMVQRYLRSLREVDRLARRGRETICRSQPSSRESTASKKNYYRPARSASHHELFTCA